MAGQFSTNWQTESASSVVPKQENSADCGMFVIKYADYISRDLPISLCQSDISLLISVAKYEILKNTLIG